MLVDALLPHGAVVRVKSGLIKKVFWATPPMTVPRDRGRDGRGLRGLTAELARLSVGELLDREQSRGPEAALGSVECHRCPWGATSRCDRHSREIWQEFLRVVEVLEQFGAVRDGALEPGGRLIAGLRHDNELILAELVARGLLADLTLAEAAAVGSALVEEARSGDPVLARVFLRKRPRLRKKLGQLEAIAAAVREAQRARRLGMPVAVHAGFMPAVFRWASGDDDWGAIVAESFGGHEGDLIRAMRRLIDLLRQLGDAPEVPAATAALLRQAARVIDRGIVLESALV